jgi:asparagine synthase (glutamine-hydrolysing)
MLHAPLTVKPSLAVLSFADVGTGEAYADVKAEVLTSGRGGDHIFHRSRTASIAADAVRDGREMRELLTIALDTARLTRRSVWGVFEAMLVQAASRSSASVIKRSAAASLLCDAPPEPELQGHPWLEQAKRPPPARAQRVGHLRDALSYHDRSASNGGMRAFPLLLAQPIVDVCLKIPPYVMTAGGRDRSLARAAFADLAPDLVMARTLKGETTRYFAAVLDANRAWICDALARGELAQSDLLNQRRFLDLVKSDWRQNATSSDGLYSLIAVEAWLRNLSRCKRRAATAQSAEAA